MPPAAVCVCCKPATSRLTHSCLCSAWRCCSILFWENKMSILTHIAGWPLLAALLLLFVPGNYCLIIRAIAILATFISMVLAIKMFVQFAGAPVDADGYRF